MKINAIILFLCSLFLYACYEDKGDYDYAPIDEVTVDFDLTSYGVAIGEEIEIKPTLEFKNPADSVNFSYEWLISGKLYATTRDLKYTGEELGSNFTMYTVINNRTKVRTIKEILIQVSSPYNISGAPGWFVLSDKEGESVLHMVSSKYVDGAYQYIARRDIYNGGGEELGREPVKLIYHAPYYSFPELLVIQRGGQKSVELDVNSMARVIRNDEEFFNGQPPVDFVPQDAYYGMWADILLGEDGKLYSRPIAEYEKLHRDPFNNNPMLVDPKKESRIKALGVAPAFANEVVVYDELNNRLLCIGTDFRYGGDVQEMPTASYPVQYTPLNDMGNKELIYLGVGDPMNFNMIVKDPSDGKYYFQRFMLQYMAYNNTFMLYPGGAHKELGCAGYFTSQTQIVVFRDGNYIFFTGGAANNELYRHDTRTNVTVLVKGYEDTSIQLLRLPNVMAGESTLGVVFTNGDVVSLDMSSANINANIYEELFRHNFGNVVDVVAK